MAAVRWSKVRVLTWFIHYKLVTNGFKNGQINATNNQQSFDVSLKNPRMALSLLVVMRFRECIKWIKIVLYFKNYFSSYIVDFKIDPTTNLCAAVADYTDKRIGWASAILTGDACPDDKIAKVIYLILTKVSRIAFS